MLLALFSFCGIDEDVDSVLGGDGSVLQTRGGEWVESLDTR